MLGIKTISFLAVGFLGLLNISLQTLLQDAGADPASTVTTWLNIGVAGAAVVVLAWFCLRLYNDNQKMHEERANDLTKRAESAEKAKDGAITTEQNRQQAMLTEIKSIANAHSQAMSNFGTKHDQALKDLQAKHSQDEDRRSSKQSNDTGKLFAAIEKLSDQIAKDREAKQKFDEGMILALEGLSNGFAEMTAKLSEQDDLRKIREELDRLRSGR